MVIGHIFMELRPIFGQQPTTEKIDENQTPNFQKPFSDVKNCFFQKPTRLRFWPVEFFLRIFKARYAYKKYSSESKPSFNIA